MFMENLPKKGPLSREFWAQKPTHMGGTYPYPQHVMYPPPPGPCPVSLYNLATVFTASLYFSIFSGMKDYLKTFSNKLSQQNTNSLSFYRNELSSFYGKIDFLDALHGIGHTSYTRSNVRTAKKDQHATDFGQTGEVCLLLFSSGSE